MSHLRQLITNYMNNENDLRYVLTSMKRRGGPDHTQLFSNDELEEELEVALSEINSSTGIRSFYVSYARRASLGLGLAQPCGLPQPTSNGSGAIVAQGGKACTGGKKETRFRLEDMEV